MATHKENNTQQGSVFLYILIAIALFGALAYSLSRGTKGQSTSNLTKAQSSLIADDILTLSQQVSQAVNHLRQNGCSESELSFQRDRNEDGTIADNPTDHYNPISPSDKSCHIYDPEGGNIQYRNIEGLDFFVSGVGRVRDVGCDLSQASCSELFFVAQYTNLTADICEAVNKKLGITGIPEDTYGSSFSLFLGTFNGHIAAIGDVDAALVNKKTACYLESDEGKYIFYSVLIER